MLWGVRLQPLIEDNERGGCSNAEPTLGTGAVSRGGWRRTQSNVTDR